MRRTMLILSTLTTLASPLCAATFEPARIAPDLGLDALTRGVARAQLGRDVFATPWSAVTIGTTDVYDVFPYVETRTIEIVADPRWNRLVAGEPGRALRAYDGRGTALGALSDPRGMDVDDRNRVYVADAGNDRVVVLQVSTEFADARMTPLYEIRGLHHPQDVALSDGGTPFAPDDDVLYVADTGANRIVAYALGGAAPRAIAEIGSLGGGAGHFAGPMAIAAGRDGGVSSRDVYVADAHSRRLVRLRLEDGALRWISDVHHDADVVTSLDTDAWGNLYAAAPNQGVVRKFNPDLAPVAELRGGLSRPRSFHVPFVTVRDHRDGRVMRQGRPSGVSVSTWDDTHGIGLWTLGLEVSDLALAAGTPAARFTLTDAADVSIEITDAGGQSRARQSAGVLAAGAHAVTLSPAMLAAAAGGSDLVLRVSAASRYPQAPGATARTAFRLAGGAAVLPSRPVLLGTTPSPAVSRARIAYVLPDGVTGRAKLRVFDSMGRELCAVDAPAGPGRHEVTWDGRARGGAAAPAGVYFYSLEAGALRANDRLVLVR